MSRKDNRGRNLRRGESQRKNGLYMYRYTDYTGERKTVYSWRLVETDKTPPDKRMCIALRTMEKEIERDLDDGIRIESRNMTVNDMFDAYIADKRELKEKTRISYRETYNRYVRKGIGERRITQVRFSEIKRFYNDLIDEKGLNPSSIKNVDAILHPVFQTAVRDGMIRLNPVSGAIGEMKKSHKYQKQKRIALTLQEQEVFLQFMNQSPVYRKWLHIFVFMLGTGCRVGEVTGLTWADCDFKNNMLHIHNNMQYYRAEQDMHYGFHLSTVKSEAGKRDIPMLSEVRRVLLKERQEQIKKGIISQVVDGVGDYVFVKKNGNLYSKTDLNHALKNIICAYNERESRQEIEENREPFYLRHFSCHNLRHTFATRFCENETNIKVIQEIMGHTDIKTTMDVYAEATTDARQRAIRSLEGKIKIS